MNREGSHNRLTQRAARWWRAAASVLVWSLALPAGLLAQANQGEAWIASVAGKASRLSGAGGAARSYDIARFDRLSPGDVIDTRGGGQVVIGLKDGSQVIVYPGSEVELKDFRHATSARELLRIALGRVRVIIHRVGSRPNPYRVNSPTASIAVRGTTFDVDVFPSAETQVALYEGVVDVESFARPGNRRTLQPGNRVIIRPDGDISVIAFNLGTNPNAKTAWMEGANDPQLGVKANYERYRDNLVENSSGAFIARFLAFADPHLDSLENPAYAGEFNRSEGRVYMLPTVNGSRHRATGSNFSDVALAHPLDYTFSPQATFFFPVPGRVVLGAAVSATRTRLEAFTYTDNFVEEPEELANDPSSISGLTNLTGLSTAFMAARRFGETGRTSLGVKLDHMAGRGTLDQSFNVGGQVDELQRRAELDRVRLTAGFAHDFAGGKKLGAFYRQSVVSASDREREHFIGGVPAPLNFKLFSTHGSEVGARWRSPLTRRLFYGLEGSWLTERVSQYHQSDGYDYNERVRARRAAAGGGLGYLLRPRTVFSLDLAGGIRHTNRVSRDEFGESFFTQRERGKFWSLQAAAQTDLYRQLFVSGSYLRLGLVNDTGSDEYPDLRPIRDRVTLNYGNVGAGWRLSNNLLVQYVYSTDFGRNPSSHSVMLRYTFSLSREK